MKVDTYKINVYTFLTPPTVADYKGNALCVLSRLYVIHSEFEFNSQNRNGWHSHYNCNAWHRVHSHQESPLVHLLWSGLNTMLIFLFGVVHFHTALFTSEPEFVNKTTLKVLRSFIHWFTHSTVPEFIWNLFSLVSVRLFGAHPSAIAVFTPVLFGSTESNSSSFPPLVRIFWTGVNTPIAIAIGGTNVKIVFRCMTKRELKGTGTRAWSYLDK